VIDENVSGDLIVSHAVRSRDDDSRRHVRAGALGEAVKTHEMNGDDLGIPVLDPPPNDVLIGLSDLVFGRERASPQRESH
jgi:hypothetical protein